MFGSLDRVLGLTFITIIVLLFLINRDGVNQFFKSVTQLYVAGVGTLQGRQVNVSGVSVGGFAS